jgi:Na+/melibiose symporter-like transporter
VRWIPLNSYWFGVSFMWGAVHSLILPQLVDLYGGSARNSLYGLLTFAGLVVAMLATPLSGGLSDRTVTRWGRRRPWMLVGAILASGCLYALVSAQTYVTLGFWYLALQLSSNLAHGPGQGLIPDCVPESQRGVASGTKSMLDMLGVVAAALVISRVLSRASGEFLRAAAIVIAMLLASLAVTLRGAREPLATAVARPRRGSVWAGIRATYAMDLVKYGQYGRLLASRFCILLGVYAVQAFAYYFVADVIHPPDPARTVGNLMAIIGVSVMVASYPSGRLSERLGRKPLSIGACVAVAAGMLLLSQVHDAGAIGVLGALIGLGMGVFNAVNWAWATDLVPPEEAGRYLGLSNLATAGSGATARLVGPLIDLANGWRPEAGYALMFAVATAGALAALGITLTLGGGAGHRAQISRPTGSRRPG